MKMKMTHEGIETKYNVNIFLASRR